MLGVFTDGVGVRRQPSRVPELVGDENGDSTRGPESAGCAAWQKPAGLEQLLRHVCHMRRQAVGALGFVC